MKYKKLYNIVFSDKRSFRWQRHFLFWLAVFIYHTIRIGLMYPPLTSMSLFFSLLGKAFLWGVISNMVITYSIVYLLIPKYFKAKKYISFLVGVITIMGLVFGLNIIYTTYFNPQFSQTIGLDFSKIEFRSTIIRHLGNPPLICGLFLSLKILKNWHLEQARSETLAKENANAELQLLKAQVHPHFLFNTLNNIYSFSLNQSPQAGALVQKLSGMLDYMIHECEERLVPLEKELRLIQDYMGLEKVRYGKRLDMQVEIHGDFQNKFIAPLLMIPFIENSFKHGTSQMLQHPRIKLEITTVGNQLFLKLSNSKPSLVPANKQNNGIGLLNVKKRLQLLYPGHHQLYIDSTVDTFIVQMQIMLNERDYAQSKTMEVASGRELAYV